MTIVAGYGVVGTGFATFITNGVIFCIQNYFVRNIKTMQAAINVRFFDKRNWNIQGFKSYIAFGLPSSIFLIIDWSAPIAMTIIAGYLSLLD